MDYIGRYFWSHWSSLICLQSDAGQLASLLLVFGWQLAEVTGQLTTCLSLSRRRSRLFIWECQDSKKKQQKCAVSWGPGSEPGQCHFYHILLAKESHTGSPGWEGRNLDFIFWWEKLQSQIAKSVDRGKGRELWLILPSTNSTMSFLIILVKSCKGLHKTYRGSMQIFKSQSTDLQRIHFRKSMKFYEEKKIVIWTNL